MVQPALRNSQPAKPVTAITVFVGSVFSLLSTASYSSRDPSFSFATSETGSLQNWGGMIGSYWADLLLQGFGILAYALIFLIGMISLRLMHPRFATLGPKSEAKHSQGKIYFFTTLLFICAAGLLGLIPFKIYSSIHLGGGLGFLVAKLGVLGFSPIGASLLFSGGCWAGLVVVTGKQEALPTTSVEGLAKWRASAALKLREQWKKLRERPAVHQEPKPELSAKLEALFKKWPTKNDSSHSKPNISSSGDSSLSFGKIKDSSEITKEKRDSSHNDSPSDEEKPAKPLLQLFKPKTSELKTGERQVLVQDMPLRAKSNPSHYDLPALKLLDLPENESYEVSKDELIENSKILEQKLLDFEIQGRVTDIRPGPIITLYEFEPAPGVKVKNIFNLTDDLKLAMKALSIRILAPVPGKAAVGIEIPNHSRQTVYLRQIIASPLFQNSRSKLTMALGKSTSGEPYVADLAKMPHLLIAGSTGSGKSVGLNAMIASILFKATPEDLKFIMIDPKMLELSVYDGIPHMLLPVVTDPKKAAQALKWAVKEMERRYKLISTLGAKNLASYNQKVEQLSADELKKEMEMAAQVQSTTSALINKDSDESEDDSKDAQEESSHQTLPEHFTKMPNIIIVIDELADLIMVAARDVEESIARLAQMARAAGIHLILATQRPSVDVITGVIKANLPTRVAYQVASKVDSRTIIDTMGAENLIGDGDLLFLPPGTSRLVRLHGPFVSEDEIHQVVKHWKTQGSPDYATTIQLEEMSGSDDDQVDSMHDDLYDEALNVVFETQSPSASMLQRRLRVGYNRAARLIERMEAEGIVSPPMGGGKGREILVTRSE